MPGPTEEDYSALAADPAFSATEMHMFIAAFIAAQSIPKNQRLLKGKALWFTFTVGLSMGEFICYAAAVFVALKR